MALKLLNVIAIKWKMDRDVFLMLKSDTIDVLLLLFSLKQFYLKNKYQVAVHTINGSIVDNNVSLMMIEGELAKLECL
jgi:hypothetical protein